jgi:hypothetical protein
VRLAIARRKHRHRRFVGMQHLASQQVRLRPAPAAAAVRRTGRPRRPTESEKQQPRRAALPERLPRVERHHEPENTLCSCGCLCAATARPVKASAPSNSKADYKGKRLASTKGSTSELSIKMNGSEPVTFQDTGSAYMAVQQNKALGMVANTMTITKLVNQSKTSGVELKMIPEPMAFQPIGVGMKKDEPALLAKINETLLAMDKAGEINQIWAKWLGPTTEFKMVREDKVVPLAELKFTPLP